MIANRNFTIESGKESPQTVRGNFIRCLASGGQLLQVQTENLDGTTSMFEMEAGLAFAVKSFEKMRIRNKGDQVAICKFVFSNEGYIQDNRLVGNLDLNGTISVLSTMPTFNTWSNNNVLSGGEIFPSRAARRALTFTPVDEIILQSGQTIKAGLSVEWNTKSALNLHANSADSVIEIMEDFD
jgi:hypothetical protein